MWELLNKILEGIVPSLAGAGLQAFLSSGGQPGGGPGGLLPGTGGQGTPGVISGGTPTRPMSMNFQGGFTGGPPLPGTVGSGNEAPSGGTGFTSLGRNLYSRRPGGSAPSGGYI